MTTKEMFELSYKICDKLSDYRQEMKNAIITCMNERGVNEIDLRKMREDNEENGLLEVAERFDDIANNHIDSYRDHSPDKDSIEWNGPADYADMEEFVKKSGAQVIKNKGATFYAVAVSVCHLCKCLQSTAGTALTVSTLMHGEYGVDDVCLSTLALVDRTGVRGKILNHLTEDEIAKLRHSAECLRTVIGNVEI